jgi:hypothetical protein
MVSSILIIVNVLRTSTSSRKSLSPSSLPLQYQLQLSRIILLVAMYRLEI